MTRDDNTFSPPLIHIDADAFFVSVEQALDPSLKGKPVVTGAERGIVSALSYPAKALGITRGMPIYKVKREYPEVTVRPSDYYIYSLFSRRMVELARRRVDNIEEYSIDEFFIYFSRDFTYSQVEKLAGDIKNDIARELGITVSAGIAPTKVLAKLASSRYKPNGLQVLNEENKDRYLDTIPLDKVWGIGGRSAAKLQSWGMRTAGDLRRKSRHWAETHLAKPVKLIWYELQGCPAVTTPTSQRSLRHSMRSSRSFSPTSQQEFLFGRLVYHSEKITRKLRQHGLMAGRVAAFLKSDSFRYFSDEATLHTPTQDPGCLLTVIRQMWPRLLQKGIKYRSAGVIVSCLTPEGSRQQDLWSSSAAIQAPMKVVDELNRKFGDGAVHLASSLDRYRKQEKGTKKESRRFNIPVLGEVD